MVTIEIRDILDNETGKTIFPRTHVDAVIGLKDFSFFEEKVDPLDSTKKYIQLKEEYTGLMSPFWMAAGGVGSPGSGGGGGGLIDSVKGVADLNTPIVSEVLTETFSSKAIQTIWDAVKVLQNTTPNVSLVNGANNSTLTVNGTTADFYTKAQVDGLIGGIHNWEPVPVVTLPAASASTMYKLYLVPSEDPQTQNVRDEYITIRSGSVGSYTYSWEQIGSTAIDLSGYVTTQQLGSWAGSSNITTLGTITTGTWSGTTIGVTKGGTGLTSISKGAMLYASASNTISALSANGTTTKKFLSQTSDNAPSWVVPALSDISGTDDLQAIEGLTGTSGLLKKTAANTWTLDATSYLPSGTTLDSIADGSARKLADYLPLSGGTITGNLTVNGTASFGSTVGVSDAISLVGTTVAKRRIYFGDSTHYVELDDNGFHFSHGVYSDGYVAAGGIGAGGGSGSATELGDLVDVSLTSRSNGDLLVYNSATSHWENKPQSSIIPSVSIGFNDLTSHPTTLAGYGITDAKIANGVITLGENTIEPATKTWVLGQNFLQPADLSGYVTFDSLETELADYVPNTRKVNNHALTSDIVLAKGDVGLGNVENTALSTWTGSQNITTVGTIASGTWNGTPIANNKIANAFVSIAGNNVPLGSSLSATDLRNSLGIPAVESNIATIMSWFSEDANGNIVVNPKNNTPRGFYNSGWISNGGVGSGGGSGSGNAAWGTVTDAGVNLTVDGITRLLARGDKNKMVTLSEDEYANLATKDPDTYYFTYEE